MQMHAFFEVKKVNLSETSTTYTHSEKYVRRILKVETENEVIHITLYSSNESNLLIQGEENVK